MIVCHRGIHMCLFPISSWSQETCSASRKSGILQNIWRAYEPILWSSMLVVHYFLGRFARDNLLIMRDSETINHPPWTVVFRCGEAANRFGSSRVSVPYTLNLKIVWTCPNRCELDPHHCFDLLSAVFDFFCPCEKPLSFGLPAFIITVQEDAHPNTLQGPTNIAVEGLHKTPFVSASHSD